MSFLFLISVAAASTSTVLKPVDGVSGDHFGWSLTKHSDTEILVASYQDNNNAGSVYIFSHSSTTNMFSQSYKINAFDSSSNDEFGYAIASNELNVFVSAPNDDNRGSVYIFHKNTSSIKSHYYQTQKIISPDTLTDFGESVTISYPYLFIGAPGYVNKSGCVYIYQHHASNNQYTFVEKIITNDGNRYDLFGSDMILYKDHNMLIIGAYGNDYDTGAVYVFKRNNIGKFIQYQKIIGSDKSYGDWFGYSVYLYNNILIIGAPGDTNSAGKAYIFEYNGLIFVEKQIIKAKISYVNDGFGSSISMNNNNIFIGVLEYHNENKGAVHIFQNNNGQYIEVGIMHALIRSSYDYFGWNILPYNGLVLISADGDSNNIGTVYAYNSPNIVKILTNDKKKTSNAVITVSVIIMVLLLIMIIFVIYKIYQMNKNKENQGASFSPSSVQSGTNLEMKEDNTAIEMQTSNKDTNGGETQTNKGNVFDMIKKRNDRRVDKVINAATPAAIHTTPSANNMSRDDRIIEQNNGLLNDDEVGGADTGELILPPLNDADESDENIGDVV